MPHPQPAAPAATPVAPTVAPKPSAAALATADLAHGDAQAAAKDYIQAAAQSRGEDQLAYLLKAAKASLEAHRPQVGVLLCDQILRLTHDPALRSDALWVRAQGYQDQHQSKAAKGDLEALLDAKDTPVARRISAMGTLASIYQAEGHDLTALDYLIRRDSLLSGAARSANHHRIHTLLDQQSSAKLTNWQGRSGNPEVQEWLAFALIVRQHVEPAHQQAAFAQWLAAHPGHPPVDFSGASAEAAQALHTQGDICALLPQTGKFTEDVNAFMAGLDVAAQAHAGAPVRLLSTMGNPSLTATLYTRGAQGGCKAFIGPMLPQDTAATLAVRQPDQPPILLLTPELGQVPQGVYTFDLGQASAVVQAAVAAHAAGYTQAVVLYPQDSAGASLQAAFLSAWKEQGGQVANVAHYRPGASEEGSIAQNALSGPLPRRTFVLALGTATQVSALVQGIRSVSPQLPILIPGVIDGGVAGLDAQGWSKVYALAMPWSIAPSTADQHAQQTLRSQLPNATPRQWEMAGLGLDAYTLMEHILQHASATPTVSGTLHWSADGRIQRQLQWVHWQNAVLMPLGRLPAAGS